MAKEPRRRSGSGRGERPRRPREPEAAKPVKPPTAKPIKPPTAKPVRPPTAKPVSPPAARPVKPVAKPLSKPVAKPVAPQPAASAEPAPSRGGSRGRSRMREEEVGRSGRGGRRGRATPTGGGMSLAAKAAVLTALVALVCIGLAVFLSRAGAADEDAQLDAFGLQAASVLAGPDAGWYRGTASTVGEGTTGFSHYEKVFKALLGDIGAQLWDEQIALLTRPIPREIEGSFAAQTLEKRQKAFQKEKARLDRGASGGSAKTSIKHRFGLVWSAMADAEDRGRYQVLSGWLRDMGKNGAEGPWVAGNIEPSTLSYDWTQWQALGTNKNHGVFGFVDGKSGAYPVRIFTSEIRAAKGADPIRSYVAVYQKPEQGGGGALGLLMLVLGPILISLTAYAVGNRHTKDIKTLAREIDRLGSSGDPERSLHAHGADAAVLARSVERMVSNLEFRQKHDGDDLDEVVSREQKIAEEIHGAMIRRNPPRLDNYEAETLFKPGFEIGGDYFEYFSIDDTHLGIILLDTNVRGIPAALVMAAARSYVRAEAPGELSPAAVLRKVNRHLAGDLPAGRHVTALYAVLDTAGGTATLASAGHLPLLVYRHQAGKMAKVNPEGIAMGLDAGPVFDQSLQEGEIPMGVGDRIVLYTDGALRIQNGEGEEFGEQRFYGAVSNEAPKNSQAFVNFVGAAIDRFHLDVAQNDDITISTIKRLR